VPAALVDISAVLIFNDDALLGTMMVMMMMSPSCPVSIVSSEASKSFFRWVARGGLSYVEMVPIMGFLLMLMLMLMLMAVIAPAGATSFSLFGVSLVVFEPLSDRQGA
jgi:hypothetical protein